MKNYHFRLLALIFTFVLSGCSVVHLAESVALLPVAIVDGVVGTKMHSSITSGLSELEKPGKKIDKQSLQLLQGKTLSLFDRIVYLDASGVSFSQMNREEKIKKSNWFFQKEGTFCTSHDRCYDLRQKDNSILDDSGGRPITIVAGDSLHLSSRFETQQKQEVVKQAELDRQKAQEKVDQERAEAEQKRVQQKADAEQKRLAAIEERCTRTPSCRAKKERAEHQRELAANRDRKQACDRLYVGKLVNVCLTHSGFFSNYSGCLEAQILGVSKENGVATAKVSRSGMIIMDEFMKKAVLSFS